MTKIEKLTENWINGNISDVINELRDDTQMLAWVSIQIHNNLPEQYRPNFIHQLWKASL